MLVGWATLVMVGLTLAGCSSPAPGVLDGTAAACNGIYPVNGLTPQDVGTLRLEVIVQKQISPGGGPEVTSQQLKGTLANSFRPSYRMTVPAGTYRVIAVGEGKAELGAPIESRRLQVKSGATTHWDTGCTYNGDTDQPVQTPVRGSK